MAPAYHRVVTPPAGSPDLDALVDQLADDAKRDAAARALAALGAEAVPALIRGLAHRIGAVRTYVASVLYQIGAPTIAPALNALESVLQDTDPVARLRAAQAIFRLRPDHRPAHRACGEALTASWDWIRSEAAVLLADDARAYETVRPALEAAATDPSPAVRTAVQRALRKLAPPTG